MNDITIIEPEGEIVEVKSWAEAVFRIRERDDKRSQFYADAEDFCGQIVGNLKAVPREVVFEGTNGIIIHMKHPTKEVVAVNFTRGVRSE